MNELTVYLFHDFLTNPTDELNTLYETRDALDTEAMRAAFEAGYAAALKVQNAKCRLAVKNYQRRAREAVTA